MKRNTKYGERNSMTNYYEILEVSEKASKEVIEKAYRVLAKKYHPDGKPQEEKAKAEQKMKQINEAYDILSNEEKRKNYDEQLQWEKQQEENKKKQEAQRKMQETYEQMLQEEIKINAYKEQYGQNTATREKNHLYYESSEDSKIASAKAIHSQMQRAYRQAYNDYWRSRGYKIKEKWTWKKTKDLLKVLAIILLIILFLWFFPPTHEAIISFYEGNFLVKAIVDVIVNIVKGLGTGIYEFILKIFGN